MFYEFEVPGKITGKGRPRINTETAIAYTPARTKDYEELIKQYFIIKHRGVKLFDGRICITIKAFISVPKSASKKEKLKMLEGCISPTKKPDIDNIAKIVLDALNKLAFKDDNQVTKINVEKIYSTEEKLYVRIEEY